MRETRVANEPHHVWIYRFGQSNFIHYFAFRRIGARPGQYIDRLDSTHFGHENRTTTEIYLHSIDEIDRVAMEYLGAQIEKSLTQILTQKKLRDYDNLVSPDIIGWPYWKRIKKSLAKRNRLGDAEA